ncbi:MAG TPA: MFS transporter [Anaerolineales bacterium]|nr:MFS transporter [Anaerolineales bacterium]
MENQPLVNDKKEIFGWMMYDWANSAFSTTIGAALLGPYITTLAENAKEPLQLFGTAIRPAAIYPFFISLSVLLQVLFLPLIGTLADYTPNKKRLMMSFAYLGAALTILLFFVQADMPVIGTNGAVLLGSLLFTGANLSFGAAVVAYNSFLNDISTPDRRDAISSQGWALGYLGGGLLLLLNLGLILAMKDTGLAVRISLASAGVWWLVFTFLFPQRRLRQRFPPKTLPKGENLFSFGLHKLQETLREMRAKYPRTGQYLIAYLVYNDGIQTVIATASLFAASELGLPSTSLLLLVLMIQFVAFGGALLFGKLAERIGAKRSIIITLVIWAGITIFAYAILRTEAQLFALGVVLALVMGGSQALSRSLFSQMIPHAKEAEYFGFYEISERGTSWLGPILFSLAVQLTGSQRVALLSLIAFFIIGLILLIPVNVKQAIVESGNNPDGVIL